MEVIISKSSDEVSRLAANKIKNQIHKKPTSVLGLATGSTPLEMYEKFIQISKESGLDLSKMTSFNLDEYVGVGSEHPGSYAYYMKKNWLEPLGLDGSRFNIPNGKTGDVAQECLRYEESIKEQGPIDLQVLGIGRDGHIGFNEPSSSFGSRTRLKTLTETTRNDNRALFSEQEEIPRHVMTMGIQTIMDSKEIILLAFGEEKANAVAEAVEGAISAQIPASILQFHPNVKIFLDEAAASGLKNKAYYQEVFANKPPWQMAEFV